MKPVFMHANPVKEMLVRNPGEARILKHLGYFGSLTVQVNLKSLRGLHWLYGTGSAVYDKLGAELDKNISFDLPELSEALYSDPYLLGSRILETIYYACNWS